MESQKYPTEDIGTIEVKHFDDTGQTRVEATSGLYVKPSEATVKEESVNLWVDHPEHLVSSFDMADEHEARIVAADVNGDL